MKKLAITFTLVLFGTILFSQNKNPLQEYKSKIISKDSLQFVESVEKMVRTEMVYELEKQEAVYKAEEEKKDAIIAAEIERLKTIMITLCVVSLFVIGFAMYVLKKRKKVSQ